MRKPLDGDGISIAYHEKEYTIKTMIADLRELKKAHGNLPIHVRNDMGEDTTIIMLYGDRIGDIPERLLIF